MSNWKRMSDEQKQRHRENERTRRALKKESLCDEDRKRLSEQRRVARERRMARDIAHHREVARKYKRDGKGWFYSWANAIKQRAADKGLPYDLDADYIQSILPTHCPVLGIELVRRAGRSGNSPSSPTVDRIVPELGYVRGNVMIISKRANQIKSDASPEEIMKVAQFYAMLINQ